MSPPRSRVLLGVGVCGALALALGPRARVEPRWVEPDLPDSLPALALALENGERSVPALRPGDQKEIVWADPSAPARTAVAIVYLHGFSADRHEVEPVVSQLADALGANVWFARLHGHGRDGPAMGEATAEAWLDDATEALAVGRRIGERVVVIGTSTGGTLATWAAARPEGADRVAALVLISPNFRVADPASAVLTLPWGGQIARLVVGPERCFEPENADHERHWTTCYPTSVLPRMLALVEHVRTMDLSGIRAPTLVLYNPGDRIVDPAETLDLVERMTGTDPVLHVIDDTSDPSRHVIAGDIVSPTSTASAREAILDFLRERGIE